jgi:toxin ParE1/3/4
MIDDKIANAVDVLELFPEAGRWGRVADTRELVVPRTNYIVVYRFTEEGKGILILRVIHGAQDWPEEAG